VLTVPGSNHDRSHDTTIRYQRLCCVTTTSPIGLARTPHLPFEISVVVVASQLKDSPALPQ
jgi:hypothetical protein